MDSLSTDMFSGKWEEAGEPRENEIVMLEVTTRDRDDQKNSPCLSGNEELCGSHGLDRGGGAEIPFSTSPQWACRHQLLK